MNMGITRLLEVQNLLTLSRIFMLPILFVLALQGWRKIFVFLYAVMCLTDFFDGMLARHLKRSSEFGAKLDCFADEVMKYSLVIFLYILSPEMTIFLLPWIAYYFMLYVAVQIIVAIWRKSAEKIVLRLHLGMVYYWLTLVGIGVIIFFDIKILPLWVMSIHAGIITIYRIEEMLVKIISKKVDSNTGTILRLWKKD